MVSDVHAVHNEQKVTTHENETCNEQGTSVRGCVKQSSAVEKRRLFTGSFTRGIDTKGRLIVPANYRKLLGNTIVVAPTSDFLSVAIYPYDEWEKMELRLETLLSFNAKTQRYIDQFNKYSYIGCDMDTQGRLLLPHKIRERYLKDCEEVEVCGAKTHLRVISTSQSAQEDDSFMQDIPNPLEFLADIQKTKKEE